MLPTNARFAIIMYNIRQERLGCTMKYRCLVLDHDDTVVQSEATINFPCFQQTLAQFRPGVNITLEEYLRGCFSLGFAEMCRQQYGFTDQEMDAEYKSWQEYMQSHIPAPFPGIGEVIRRQKAAGGLVCVVSHSREKYITRDYAAHFGIAPDAIFGCDLPQEQCKPNSYPLERIMETFDLKPHELLVVDDLMPAYEMAQKVDAPFAFAAWSKQAVPEIVEHMRALGTLSFHSPKELGAFLFEE